MSLLEQPEETSNRKFSLYPSFNYVLRTASIFGFGKPPDASNRISKIFYGLYSILAICLVTFGLIRLLLVIDYSANFGVPLAGILLSIVAALQGLLSALFLIYKSRRNRFHYLKTKWIEFEADELISETNFQKAKYKHLVPVVIFLCVVLISEIAEIFLEYYGLTIESMESRSPLVPYWQLFVLLPASIFSNAAWIVAFFAFYYACLSLSYAWQGLSTRLANLSRQSEKGGNSNSNFNEAMLRSLSSTHWKLIKLTDTISEVFGAYAFFMIVLAVPDLFIQIYFAYRMPQDAFLKAQTVVWLLCSLVAVVYLFSASRVNTQAGLIGDAFYRYYYAERMKVRGNIQIEMRGNIQIENAAEEESAKMMNEKTLIKATILQTKMKNSQIYVSACDWFVVSNETLSAIITIFATAYYILGMG